MPKTRAQKAESVERLAKALKAAKSAMFADYQGMSVQSITDLRKKLKAEEVDYIVAKKTLLTRSAKEAGYDIDFKNFPGMLGIAVSQGDDIAPARIIGEAGKRELPIKLVGGIFDGQVVDQEYVVKLSKLPSRNQLLGQLLSVLNGPAGAFVRLLNAYKEKQEAGTPAPVVEAPQAEAAPAPAEAAPAAETPAPETPAA